METKREINRIDQDLLKLLPFSKSELVEDVTFIAPDTEQKVNHKLGSTNLVYFVVARNQPCDVYDVRGQVGAIAWTNDYIILLCNQTATVSILLGVKR